LNKLSTLIANKDFYVLVFVCAGLAGWCYNGLHSGTFGFGDMLVIWGIPLSVYVTKSAWNSQKGEEPK